MHPSVQAIREHICPQSFDFHKLELDSILKEINKLDIKKQGTVGNIPTVRLKEMSGVCDPFLVKIWNEEIIDQKKFPENLKLADVTPIFKKDDVTCVKNYRPVSVLPSVSKVFERLMQGQMISYF